MNSNSNLPPGVSVFDPHINPPANNIEDTELNTWFERDRAHVELRYIDSQETIIEWWDEAVQEAITDGFLDPARYHESAWEYALYIGLV